MTGQPDFAAGAILPALFVLPLLLPEGQGDADDLIPGLFQQGGGGLNGSVAAPYGAQAAGDAPALSRGFAVVTTDTGHQGMGGFDGSFRADQQANLDFAYAAIGRVAEIAKRIIAEHYDRPAEKSYFMGCSTGGREAMLMTQRYPLLFDGVVSGAPAMRTSYSGIGDRWVAVTLNEIAPKNEKGRYVVRKYPASRIAASTRGNASSGNATSTS